MVTRRSFVLGAAWLALPPHPASRPDGQAGEGVGSPTDLPHESVPEGYPYDKPIPRMKSKVMTPLPSRVVAGYWTSWGSPIRVKDIPARYNTVFLFSAAPVGGAPGTTGAVQWNTPGDGRGAATNFTADLAEFRRTRTAILTVGGAGANVDLSTRARAQTFLDSIKRIYGELGGFDGLDWNTYEGEQRPNTDHMIWVSRQLKSFYGRSFSITTPPAPWRPIDTEHCRAMFDAGVLDMVSPQYYDGPGLAAEDYIVDSVNEWVARMGDAGRVGVGFGLGSAVNYSTLTAVKGAWTTLAAGHPTLRGAYTWDMPTDEGMGWPFANEVGPLVMMGAAATGTLPTNVPPIIPMLLPLKGRTHTVAAGETLAGIAARYGIVDWQEIAALNGGLMPESLREGQLLKLPDAATRLPVTPPVITPTAPGGTRLPDRVVGTSWSFASGLRLGGVPPACTVVTVDFADAGDRGGGTVFDVDARPETVALMADMAELRRLPAPPRIILSTSGGPDTGTATNSTTEADDFVAEVIRVCRSFDFDGFDWNMEREPAFTAADLAWATRAIVTEMRRTKPAFLLTLTSHHGAGAVGPHANAGTYADVARRCNDIIDLVQPRYDNRDNAATDANGMRSQVQAWLDCGLRQDQIGVLCVTTPTAIAGSESELVMTADARQIRDTLTWAWPGLRGMGMWGLR